MATKYVKGHLYKLKIADLQPDPNQTRSFSVIGDSRVENWRSG